MSRLSSFEEGSASVSEESYLIEEILDERYNKKKRAKEYLIKWKGYGESDNSWEVEYNITNIALKTFYESKRLKLLNDSKIHNLSENKEKKTSAHIKEPMCSETNNYISDNKKKETSSNIEQKKKINKKQNQNKMQKFGESVMAADSQKINEKIEVTNELSEKIEKIIKIVYVDTPLYENIRVRVQIDEHILEIPIEEAEIKFPQLLIDYLDKRSNFK
ncbi:Chromodomain Y-like protein 2 [Cucumispora dikerogammari]|nr:Chromodomain Y-like protein 2 [Cucumispora dikerogammari]